MLERTRASIGLRFEFREEARDNNTVTVIVAPYLHRGICCVGMALFRSSGDQFPFETLELQPRLLIGQHLVAGYAQLRVELVWVGKREDGGQQLV